MKLKSLHILNFKNHSEADFEFEQNVNCFVGDNGAGKTNLLDAIHYLSFCKSYFNSIDAQNIQHEKDFFVVQGQFSKEDSELDEEIHCAVKRGDKKRFKRNKKDYKKLSDHIGKFPSVMISPYDRDLIGDGSDIRRKFIDSIISQLDKIYLNDLIKYNKLIKQRNAMIKSMIENRRVNQQSLEIWDLQLEPLAKSIIDKRESFLNQFLELFNEYYALISGKSEQVSIEYSQSMEGDYLQYLQDNFKKDIALQYTSVGPHKDDLIFLIEGRPIKKFGSQGQQKSYLIALKLAQYEFMKKNSEILPLLLMDDVFDKLDKRRVGNILDLVSNDAFGQVFISDTDGERLSELFNANDIDASIFQIETKKEVLSV